MVKVAILTFDCECRTCGTPLRIPIRPEFDNPVYVMEVERNWRLMRDEIRDMKSRMVQLAEECLAAGVKPTILREADEMKMLFNDLLRRFQIDGD